MRTILLLPVALLLVGSACTTFATDLNGGDETGADPSVDSANEDRPADEEDRETSEPVDTSPFVDESDLGGADSGDTSDSASGGGGPDTSGGSGCLPGQVLDCAGVTCRPASWLGDGTCDDGIFDLDCAATNFDGGDCLPVVDTDTDDGCPAGEVLDCTGQDCAPASWLGDGTCDALFDLDCAETNWDGGDCTPPPTDTDTDDGCPAGQVLDCDGQDCHPVAWLGDGTCDSFFDLDCAETNWDGGDCTPPPSDTDTDAGDTADSDPGLSCPPGEIVDCTGVDCDPASWLGDGLCDDTLGLNCAATNFDGGDCAPPPTDTDTDDGCPAGEVLDCTGLDCDPASWLGDGMCDDSLGLNCAETNFDGGDCAGGSTGSGGGANPCAAGQVPDCNGTCAPLSSVGDGTCDAAFDCAAYGNDAGDCGAYNACLPGRVPDCGSTGADSFDCSPATWLADGACDSYLDCAAFGFDAGDCP